MEENVPNGRKSHNPTEIMCEKTEANSISIVADKQDDDPEDASGEKPQGDGGIGDWFRKTGVAVAGGAMVGVGLVMIPLPTPFGALVAGSGMAVLGTEFPAAQRVLDSTCNKVADAIEKNISTEEAETTDDESEEDEESESEIHANERMRTLVDKQKQRSSQQEDTVVQRNLRALGKKAVPVIRKIGEGIDKEKLNETSVVISKAASDATGAVQSHLLKTWRYLLVLDEEGNAVKPVDNKEEGDAERLSTSEEIDNSSDDEKQKS